MTPRISVVIPARNEEADIADCLEAVAAQDIDLGTLEVIVVDGASTDRTALLARTGLECHPFGSWSVLTNVEATTPTSLNLGLAAAKGEYLVRVDARSIIPPHYVRAVVDTLDERNDVVVSGGAQRAVARDDSSRSVGIARALNNRWSTGFARYRRTSVSGPSDTVYLGAFRTSQLRDAGGWDERFPTNQDFELNRRMSTTGTVWFVGDLEVHYRPRSSYAQLWRQYVRFGRWKARYWFVTGDRPRPRQLAIVAVPPAIAAAVVGDAIRRRTLGPLVVAATAGLAAGVEIERRGADTPPADVAGHAGALLAIAVTSAGWLAGVYEGLIVRRSSPP